MHRPQHPTAAENRRCDRRENTGLALAALRRAVARGARTAIETACRALARRLDAPVGDDADEIRATLGLIAARVQFGVHPRLRSFLLPLVAAVEGQIEEAEKDL